MKAKILIRKQIRASTIEKAMRIVKTKYPFAKLVAYRFDKDFRFTNKEERIYAERTMTVAFVDDLKIIFN